MIEIKRGVPCIMEKGKWLKFATMELAEAYLSKDQLELQYEKEEECSPLVDEIL